jgi:hypothetical protein
LFGFALLNQAPIRYLDDWAKFFLALPNLKTGPKVIVCPDALTGVGDVVHSHIPIRYQAEAAIQPILH